jgi:hypothetical protein
VKNVGALVAFSTLDKSLVCGLVILVALTR